MILRAWNTFTNEKLSLSRSCESLKCKTGTGSSVLTFCHWSKPSHGIFEGNSEEDKLVEKKKD